jgi:hypothetical protein
MKSRRVLHLSLVKLCSIRFLPAIPALAVFDFVTVIEAESADNPGWV